MNKLHRGEYIEFYRAGSTGSYGVYEVLGDLDLMDFKGPDIAPYDIVRELLAQRLIKDLDIREIDL